VSTLKTIILKEQRSRGNTTGSASDIIPQLNGHPNGQKMHGRRDHPSDWLSLSRGKSATSGSALW